jgi:HEAT repeat protein
MIGTSPLPLLRSRSLGLRLPLAALALCVGLSAGCSPSMAEDRNTAASPSDPSAHPNWAKANQIISSSLGDQDPRLRAGAIEVVASTRQLRFAPRLRQLVRDPVMPVRFAAILGIGDLQYAVAAPDVKQILDETQEDANVRLAAAYALCRLGMPGCRETIRKAIADRNQTVRANAALLMGKLRDHQGLDSLYWAIQDKDSDERVVSQATESIALVGDSSIYQRLWGELISAYADDRIAGVRAMGSLGTEQAKAAIATMLNDGVIEVRLTAAEQLGRFHDASGTQTVLAALSQRLPPDTQSLPEGQGSAIRVLAALAIGEIGSEPLVRHLASLLEDKSVFVQVAAAKAVFMLRNGH